MTFSWQESDIVAGVIAEKENLIMLVCYKNCSTDQNYYLVNLHTSEIVMHGVRKKTNSRYTKYWSIQT